VIFLDSAPAIILAGGFDPKRTPHTSHEARSTVLSAADPVRVFQEFATLDLLLAGQSGDDCPAAGSSIEAIPTIRLQSSTTYDALFAEKLDLLLKIRENENITWSGKYRPALTGQGVYPRPVQKPFAHMVWVLEERRSRLLALARSDCLSWSPSSAASLGDSARW